IKQFLDLGAQSLIVPMIFTPDDARKAAAAVAYPPQGVRGIGSALARSGAWGRYANYLTTARETITLIIQIETAQALEHLDDLYWAIRFVSVHGLFRSAEPPRCGRCRKIGNQQSQSGWQNYWRQRIQPRTGYRLRRSRRRFYQCCRRCCAAGAGHRAVGCPVDQHRN